MIVCVGVDGQMPVPQLQCSRFLIEFDYLLYCMPQTFNRPSLPLSLWGVHATLSVL